MNMFILKRNISRVIAVSSVIALAFVCTACNFEIIRLDDKTSGIVTDKLDNGDAIPPSDEVTIPPALDPPEAEELVPPDDEEYVDAVNNAFISSELSEIRPQAMTELPDIKIASSLVNNTELEIPKEVEKLILNYHTDRYAALGGLKFLSTSQYFDNSTVRGKLYSVFNDTVIEYLIFVRRNRTADLSYDKAMFRISVNEAEETAKGYKLTYMINDAINFAFSDVTSYSAYMEAEVVIEKSSDGTYRFTQYAEDTDVNLLFEEQVMNYLGYDYEEHYLKDMTIPAYLQSNRMMLSLLKKQKYLANKDIELQKKILEQVNEDPEKFVITSSAKNKYDAEKAVAYSYEWVDRTEVIRNPYYSDYSIYGGNCQNYVSQCLLAGGIPMDTEGSYEQQWKWYSDYSNHYQTAWGRVPSWAGTEAFYEYTKSNTGNGLVAKNTKYIYIAKPGDVMQYVVDDWASHSVIVSKVIYDDEGKIVEILVNSNTTDHVDFPLTAYGYTNIRLIRIAGYN